MTPVVSVQNRYNVDDRGSESLIDLCEQEQLAFLPWAPIQDLDSNAASSRDRRATRRHAATGRARVAAGPIAGDTADSGHRVGEPPREQRRPRPASSSSPQELTAITQN